MGQLVLIVIGVVLAIIIGIWLLGAVLSLASSFIVPLILVAIGIGLGIWIAGRGKRSPEKG